MVTGMSAGTAKAQIGLGKMFPVNSFSNFPNRIGTDPVSGGYLSSGTGIAPNCNDLGFSQFRRIDSLTAHLSFGIEFGRITFAVCVEVIRSRVRAIRLGCQIFKILYSAVRSHAINVIDLLTRRAGTEKSTRNHGVYGKSRTNAHPSEFDSQIARVRGGFQDAANLALAACVRRARGVSSYPTKRRSTIDPLVTRNGSPNFRFKFLGGKFLFSHTVHLVREWFGQDRRNGSTFRRSALL